MHERQLQVGVAFGAMSFPITKRQRSALTRGWFQKWTYHRGPCVCKHFSSCSCFHNAHMSKSVTLQRRWKTRMQVFKVLSVHSLTPKNSCSSASVRVASSTLTDDVRPRPRNCRQSQMAFVQQKHGHFEPVRGAGTKQQWQKCLEWNDESCFNSDGEEQSEKFDWENWFYGTFATEPLDHWSID